MKARSRRLKKHRVRLTRHARDRTTQRELDARVIEEVAEAAWTLLNGRSLRLRHRGHTIVASKTSSGQITVITAWK